jgi:hypothetical protein
MWTALSWGSAALAAALGRLERPATVERFQDLAGFTASVLVVEDQLSAEHCTQVGGPEILPHGWRGPIPH